MHPAAGNATGDQCRLKTTEVSAVRQEGGVPSVDGEGCVRRELTLAALQGRSDSNAAHLGLDLWWQGDHRMTLPAQCSMRQSCQKRCLGYGTGTSNERGSCPFDVGFGTVGGGGG